MKLIIDIPEKVVTAIQNGEDYRYDIHTAISQGTPYEDLISANDFKKRLNNMEYVYLQACYSDLIDAIDCEVTYFKEKMNHGKK